MAGKILHKDLSYKICGLLYRVHNELGRYRNEQQYADKFERQLKENKIGYKREYKLPESFSGEKSGRNICDFIIDDKIIVELKAKTFLLRDDYFQIRRYLSTLSLELGILVNFRQKYITPKRILNGEIKNENPKNNL